MKKPLLNNILTFGILVLILLAALVAAVLAGCGLFYLWRITFSSFGWLFLYVLISAIVALPLALLANGVVRGVLRTGKIKFKQPGYLFVAADLVCAFLVFLLVDSLCYQVAAGLLPTLAVGLLFAMLCQVVEQGRANAVARVRAAEHKEQVLAEQKRKLERLQRRKYVQEKRQNQNKKKK